MRNKYQREREKSLCDKEARQQEVIYQYQGGQGLKGTIVTTITCFRNIFEIDAFDTINDVFGYP